MIKTCLTDYDVKKIKFLNLVIIQKHKLIFKLKNHMDNHHLLNWRKVFSMIVPYLILIQIEAMMKVFKIANSYNGIINKLKT